jgi:hypothetical protein
MNPEIKAQWLADLRSGEYRQSTGALASIDGGYCCLGVLCEQAVKAGIVRKNSTGFCGFCYSPVNNPDDSDAATLPAAVMAWAGLDENNPATNQNITDADGIEHEEASLAELNDLGRAFAEIADIIEDQL